MTRIIALALAIAAGSITSSVVASESSQTVALDAAVVEQIKINLSAEGYDVRKVEMEDGLFEVYALKNGNRYEIYLDRDLTVVKSKMND